MDFRSTTETCVEELDCYSIGGNFSLRPLNVLPQSRDVIDTKFVLYQPHGVSTVYNRSDLESLRRDLDLESKGLIFFIHGWFTVRPEPIIEASRAVTLTPPPMHISCLYFVPVLTDGVGFAGADAAPHSPCDSGRLVVGFTAALSSVRLQHTTRWL